MIAIVFAVLAWVVSAICAGVVVLQYGRLEAVELPSAAELVRRVEAVVPPESENSRAGARFELDEQLRDVDRQTSVFASMPRSLGQIALASGTGLAIAVFAVVGLAGLIPAFIAFFGGLLGALLVAYVGRLANDRARQVREHWTKAVSAAWTRFDRQANL